MGTDGLEELRGELAAIAERLDDAILDALREAVATGERERPAIERRLTRARRAVERALAALREPAAEPDEVG